MEASVCCSDACALATAATYSRRFSGSDSHANQPRHSRTGAVRCSGPTPARSIELDVMDEGNAAQYWDRDERHDFSLSLNRGQPALDALTRVLEKWIRHFLAVTVKISQERAIDDEHWVWHVGLDAEASGLLNDLYNRTDIDDERMRRLLCLFRLEFADPADMRPAIKGRPVYLAMAMDHSQRLNLKPQNLLLNLPLARQQ